MPSPHKDLLRKLVKSVSGKRLDEWRLEVLRLSLEKGVREQGLEKLCHDLESIVPDISAQYSTRTVSSNFLKIKVRGLHAFQVQLARDALALLPTQGEITLVDIGDSAGTHSRYLSELQLASDHRKLRCLGVNIDPLALERIQKNGIEAINAKAEDLGELGIKADIFTCFQLLEHLDDPIGFLRSIYQKTTSKTLVITVPYREQSGISLAPVRANAMNTIHAEEMHVFELSPDDWRPIFAYTGWKIYKDAVYYQYPHRSVFRLLKSHWKKTDYEGFYGVILTRESHSGN